MNTTRALSVLIVALFYSALQGQTSLPKLENHLKGEIDFSIEPLRLVQKLANGKDFSSGKINTDGSIDFELPEYDIKALYDSINLAPVKFQQWFSINSDCNDKNVFVETPFDDLYAQRTKAIWIKKYGIDVAILEATSDEIKVRNHDGTKDSLALLNTYYWFYIDRDIIYKDNCVKIPRGSNTTHTTFNVDISFKKGWNFIEESIIRNLGPDINDANNIQPNSTYFTKSTPKSKKVKWKLRQVATDEEIEIAKKLYGLTPITKKQYETWAPDQLGNLSVTTKEYGKPPEGRVNKNNIHLIYADRAQEQKIEVYVVDFCKNPNDVEMVDYAYAMENDGKDEADIKSYITRYNEQENSTKLLYKVNDRMFVEATGANMKGEALWGYIQKLDVERLVKR